MVEQNIPKYYNSNLKSRAEIWDSPLKFKAAAEKQCEVTRKYIYAF